MFTSPPVPSFALPHTMSGRYQSSPPTTAGSSYHIPSPPPRPTHLDVERTMRAMEQDLVDMRFREQHEWNCLVSAVHDITVAHSRSDPGTLHASLAPMADMYARAISHFADSLVAIRMRMLDAVHDNAMCGRPPPLPSSPSMPSTMSISLESSVEIVPPHAPPASSLPLQSAVMATGPSDVMFGPFQGQGSPYPTENIPYSPTTSDHMSYDIVHPSPPTTPLGAQTPVVELHVDDVMTLPADESAPKLEAEHSAEEAKTRDSPQVKPVEVEIVVKLPTSRLKRLSKSHLASLRSGSHTDEGRAEVAIEPSGTAVRMPDRPAATTELTAKLASDALPLPLIFGSLTAEDVRQALVPAEPCAPSPAPTVIVTPPPHEVNDMPDPPRIHLPASRVGRLSDGTIIHHERGGSLGKAASCKPTDEEQKQASTQVGTSPQRLGIRSSTPPPSPGSRYMAATRARRTRSSTVSGM